MKTSWNIKKTKYHVPGSYIYFFYSLKVLDNIDKNGAELLRSLMVSWGALGGKRGEAPPRPRLSVLFSLKSGALRKDTCPIETLVVRIFS